MSFGLIILKYKKMITLLTVAILSHKTVILGLLLKASVIFSTYFYPARHISRTLSCIVYI